MRNNKLDAFREYREKMNSRMLGEDNLDIKRFFALDNSVYKEGTLDRKTKELLGLVASLVMRCNDCILYHLIRCAEEGVSDAEFNETLAIALVVGGSITIPHMRYAYEMIDEIRSREKEDGS